MLPLNTAQPAPAFRGLYEAYTAAPDSLGAHLARTMTERSAGDPLLVVTGTDVAYFPGSGAPPQIEAFRNTTRGFIEITAVSHLGTAVPWIGRLRALEAPDWRDDAAHLLTHIEAVLALNTAAYWRDLDVRAWRGLEERIAALVDYACRVTHAYLLAALADETLLDPRVVRERFLDPVASRDVPIPMDDMMAATFALAFVDIAQRVIAWLGSQNILWERAMVMIAGRAGRATAGLTWATNNMCHLLWRTSLKKLVPERLMIAPFAPSFSAAEIVDAMHAAAVEAEFRQLWNRTRASTELAREMFAGYPAYRSAVPVVPLVDASTTFVDGMPALRSMDDRRGLITRLRVVMEDPGQMISNAAAHYVIDQLVDNGNDAAAIFIPGFTDVQYPRSSPT